MEFMFVPKQDKENSNFRGILLVKVISCKELRKINQKFPNPYAVLNILNVTHQTQSVKKTCVKNK